MSGLRAGADHLMKLELAKSRADHYDFFAQRPLRYSQLFHHN
jgi:hypothetical protein